MTIAKGVKAYQIRLDEHPPWFSPIYLYRELAERECQAHMRLGDMGRVVECRVTHVPSQLVSTDKYGGCTQRRAVSDLCYGRCKGQPVIYGRIQYHRRSVMVVLPRHWTGHEPLWRRTQ